MPEVPASLEEAAPASYVDSPLIDEIAKVYLPKKFVIPSMQIYDGTTDPQNHVALYKHKMLAASIPSEFRQVCMCKGFGTILTGPALQWITQKPEETLRVFLARFNNEKVSIPRCDIGTEVEAKTLAYIRLKEDKSYKVESSSGSRDNEKSNRKSNKGNNYRRTSYSRLDYSEVNLVYEYQGKANVFPPISEHTFSVDITGLIQQLDNMGSAVRWPMKVENPNTRRDNSKRCEFHMDIGHTADDCFSLRKKVAYLLKSGYLKDLIRTKGRNRYQSKENQKQKQDRNLPPPPPIYEIGTPTVRRILVDGGSLMNLIMLDVLKAMNIGEEKNQQEVQCVGRILWRNQKHIGRNRSPYLC
ncbi:uncharacterized protein LOC141642422 [Silene latifolia]|uniref:uncharacterized protein LOC141642422 n=1 Tax=Silene latifolia TaxID=37657 RepID=UPI003D782BE8